MENLEQGGGSVATQDSDVIDVLSRYGVDDEVLQQVKESTLRHKDYTHKTQELARQREQLLQREAYLAGLTANGQKSTEQDPVEEFISNMLANNDDEQSREVAKTLRALTAAQRAAFEKEIEKRTAPALDYLTKQQASEELAEWCQSKLVPQYGSDVMKIMTPEVKKYIVGELVAGRKVDPVSVLRHVNEDAMDELRAKAKAAKLQAGAGRHLEGTVQMQRTTPPMGAGRKAPMADVTQPFDYKQRFAEVMRAVNK